MSARAWDDAQLLQVHEWRQEGRSWTWIAEQTGDFSQLKARFSHARQSGRLAAVLAGVGLVAEGAVAPPSPERMEWSERAGAADLWSRSTRIRTLDALLEAAAVDLTRWYVERHTVNMWEIGAKGPDGSIVTEPLWQVKASLRAVPGAELAHAVAADLLADMAAHAPRYEPVTRVVEAGEPHMLEVCLADLHIGMLSWGEETGADYDSDIARDIVRGAVADLTHRVQGMVIERVLLPLGNDMTHADRTIDGAGGQTTAGTSLDVDTRRARMLRMTRIVAVETIDALREVAPVEVVMVAGNHDTDSTVAMGEILGAWYRHDDAVTIRHDPTPRHYVRYGTTLLGLTHGHREKAASLPLIMATEAPKDWSETTHREWHLGHLHRKGETTEEHSGVRVRVMPSLAGEDAWHAGKGFRHMRAAEAYLWGRESGYMGHLSVGLPRILARAA